MVKRFFADGHNLAKIAAVAEAFTSPHCLLKEVLLIHFTQLLRHPAPFSQKFNTF